MHALRLQIYSIAPSTAGAVNDLLRGPERAGKFHSMSWIVVLRGLTPIVGKAPRSVSSQRMGGND
jgi:hypothetical protein